MKTERGFVFLLGFGEDFSMPMKSFRNCILINSPIEKILPPTCVGEDGTEIFVKPMNLVQPVSRIEKVN